MQKNYGITVIIPAYNAEATIQKGIESILNQTYKEIQLVVIDDGSTDQTNQVVERYTKFHNVLLVRQENQGVSSARNQGLQLAEGKYVFFLDADDYIDANTLEAMYDFAEHNKLDLVSCNHMEEHATIYRGNVNEANTFIAETHTEIGKHFFSLFPKTVWAKLFRKEILREHQLHFQEEMMLGEDWYFTFSFMKYVQSVGKVDHVYYHVENVNPLSLSKRYVKNLENDILKQYALWVELVQIYPDMEVEYYKEHMDYKAYLISLYANNLFKQGSGMKAAAAYKDISAFLRRHNSLLPDKQEKHKAPKDMVEKLTYYAILTGNGSIVGMLFQMKEWIKRRKLKKYQHQATLGNGG